MVEVRTHDGKDPRNDARTALHTLLARAEGCGPAARIAREAQDHELADVLCKVEVVEEAKSLLAQRLAE